MATTSASAPEIAETAARLRLAITRIARRMRQESLGAESAGELSPTLGAVLATVGVHGPLTPSEIATREGVRRPTVTRSLSRLEAEGLVARSPDPSDGRAALISLTAEGTALLRRVRRRKTAYLAHRMRDLDDEELAALERAAAALERILGEGPA